VIYYLNKFVYHFNHTFCPTTVLMTELSWHKHVEAPPIHEIYWLSLSATVRLNPSQHMQLYI